MLPIFIKDKAREISYALIRVTFYVKRNDLRSKLESLAIELLDNSARVSVDNNLENINHALASVSALDSLVRLAHSIYEIEPINATILVRELDSLDSAIRQSGNNQVEVEKELPDLETFFKIKPAKQEVIIDDGIDNTAIQSVHESLTEGRQSENGNSAINAAIRQSSIIGRIQQGNGNGCRLKDLLVEFPDVSERTLRYDLQRLCEKGIIERVGNGGPASYYRSLTGVKPSVVQEGVGVRF